jgi:hypothetical protein
MANTIKIKRSTTTATPTSLSEGELAYSEDSNNLFIGTSGSNVANIGGVVGTTVQAYDAGLKSISDLTTASNKMVYTTASDTYAVTGLTATARTLLDDASAADMRTTLGVDASGTVNYSLPTASGTVLGGVKVGSGITNTAGVLSVSTSYLASNHDASGVTSAKITKWDAASAWHVLMAASNDADSIVSTVAEMITLFDSTAETLDLMTALNAKMDDGQTIDGGTF